MKVYTLLLGITLFLFPMSLQAQLLKAAYTSKAIGYLPLFVAEKKGFYSAEGIKVELVSVGRADHQLAGLISGEIHFTNFSADGIILFNEKGGNLKIIAGLINSAPYILVGAKNYKKIGDLKGAKLGSSAIRGGATTILMLFLKRKGLLPGDYTMISLSGGTPGALTALETGVVAGALLQPPFSDIATDRGLNSLGDVTEVIQKYQFNSVHVNPAWAEKNRPAVVKFLKGHIRSLRWIFENPEAAAEFVTTELDIQKPYAQRGIDYFIKNNIFPIDGSAELAALKANIDILAEDGLLKEPLPRPEKHLDVSYLRQAQKELGLIR